MNVTKSEVLIIGGGVIGNSIAYHVAKQGRQVLVVERSEEVASAPAASWASAGGVRRQGRHRAEARLAVEAIARWRTLEEELGADMQYRRGGNLLLAETDAEAEQLVTFVREQQELGFADVRLVDRQEVFALVPGLHVGVVAGSYSPSDGQADPALTTRAFAAAAQRYGATYWNGTAVLALLIEGERSEGSERVVGVRTERGEIRAEQVVLAAGAWSDEVARTAGLHLPIKTAALQMVLSTPAPRQTLQPVISAASRMLSLKQLNDGSFLIGGGWQGHVAADRRSYILRQENVEGSWKTACELLPIVGQQQIVRAWCGLEALSFDDLPFIGPIKRLDGLTVAAGFSGHGFALAPAVGRVVAEQLVGGATSELDGLEAGRMGSFEEE
ncbi:MAG: FAD-binding oxidoreductase [Chloroflexota bacterium]|nr:FAD-binding oxidoreductase [Chloroflexota bacterium]